MFPPEGRTGLYHLVTWNQCWASSPLENTGWRRGDNERGTRQRRSRELHADGAQPDSHPSRSIWASK